jgi:hypothetical protein
MRYSRVPLPHLTRQPARSHHSLIQRSALSRRAIPPSSLLRTPSVPKVGRVENIRLSGTYSSFSPSASRTLHSSTANARGLIPETSEPQPRESEADEIATRPTPISIDDYHQLADSYLERLLAQLEELQEKNGEIEVEYSVWEKSHPWAAK